jgi:hypothetical protein
VVKIESLLKLLIFGLMLALLLNLLSGNYSLAWVEEERAVIQSSIDKENKEVNPLARKRWSPYMAGLAIGVLSWVAFLLMGKGLGASSSFVKTSGMIAGGMIYTRIYPKLSDGIFKRGDFGQKTLPDLIGIRIPSVMLVIFVLAIVIFSGLEIAGL